MSNDLNRNIALMASGFGTAGQQASKLQALSSMGPGPDTLAALRQVEDITKEQTAQNEHARYMAGADLLGQQFLNLKPGQGSTLAAGGLLPQLIQSHFQSLQPTEAIKNYTQARDLMKQQGMTDDQINAVMPPETLTLGPSADIGQRQYMIEKTQAAAKGQTNFPDYLTWQEQHKQAATEAEDAHKNAMALPGVNTALDDLNNRATNIIANKDVLAGIFSDPSKRRLAAQIVNWDAKSGTPDPATTATTWGLKPDEVNVLSDIRQLHQQNYATAFSKTAGSGQRVSQQEAGRLGAAQDQLGNLGTDIDHYIGNIAQLQNRVGHTRTAAYGEARDYENLPVNLRSKLDPSFLDGPNAWQGRPQWARPVSIDPTDESGYNALAPGQSYKPTKGKYAGQILIKGYEKDVEN
jgi:hypothetical protein